MRNCLLLVLMIAAPATAQPLTSRSAAPKVVFRLDLANGAPANVWTHSTTIVEEPGGKALKAEFGGGKWNSYLVTSPGLLKGGEDYSVALNYEVAAAANPRAFFYLFARSETLGNGADKWTRWQGQAGQKGTARLSISLPQVADYTITAGMFGGGSIVVDDLTIEQGTTWLRIPAVKGQRRTRPSAGGSTPTLPPDFAIQPPAPATDQVINLGKYNLTPDTPSHADTPGHAATQQEEDHNHALFQAAIDECKNRKASELVIPKGIYRVGSPYPLMFDGMEDFTLDGQGSELIFDRITLWNEPYMHLQNCKRCVFKNIILDWDWDKDPIATVGKVIDLAPDGTSFDMEFPDARNEADVDRLQTLKWNYIFAIDNKTRVPAGRDHELSHLDPTKFQKLTPTTLRVWPNRPLPLTKGQLYVVRHHEYEMDGFRLDGIENVTLEGVIIYSVPGMGYVVSNDTNHWQLLNCQIIPRPGSGRPLSTASDGFHIQQCTGFMKMLNCEFAGCGDDCLNLHDNCSMGIVPLDAKTLDGLGMDRWRNPVHIGDRIEFRNADLSPTGFSSKLTAVDYKAAGARAARLTFEDPLPAALPQDAVLFNRRYSASNMIIRNCSFHDNRGRGTLLYISDSLVEGNHWARNQSSAIYIQIEITDTWSEGDGVKNLIVRNNTFEDVNPKGTQDGAAIYVGSMLPHGSTAFPIFQNILFEGNFFSNCPGPALLVSSCKNVTFRDNRFSDTAAISDPNPLRDSIRAELASEVTLEGTEWTASDFLSRPGFEYDPATVSGILVKGNRVVPLTQGIGEPESGSGPERER